MPEHDTWPVRAFLEKRRPLSACQARCNVDRGAGFGKTQPSAGVSAERAHLKRKISRALEDALGARQDIERHKHSA